MIFQASLLMALVASASAHMILDYPVPYGKASLNSFPLAPGDFPCKQRAGVYDITQMNQWNAGETKTVSFTGSAVHGGGSCQFSLTTDPKPSAQSEWKVIQSVIGGCPSNVTGNLPEDPAGHGAATFPVTMPKDVPNGQYTFAWTWLNKVGNREFYMNCAPVQVGSGTGTASTASVAKALTSYPNMFVANLPATSCSTKAYQDFKYPNPGPNAVYGKDAAPGADLTGSGCDAQAKLAGGSGQSGSPASGSPPSNSQPSGAPPAVSPPVASPPAAAAPAPVASPPANQPAQPAQPSPSPANPGGSSGGSSSGGSYGGSSGGSASGPSGGSPGGVFAPGASPAPAPPAATPPSSQPAPPSQPAAPKSPPASSSPDNNNTSSPASGGGQCTPCTNDGAVVCIGGKQFGLCNRGCAVAQDVATGMACTNGAVVAATKRHVHFPRAHLHRRLSAAHFV